MSRFIPNMYKKDIFSIDYKKLKQMNIKVLLFDFDNTIVEKGIYTLDEKTTKLFNKIKKDFIIYIVSNSIQNKKIKTISEKLGISYIVCSMKPFKIGFKKIKIDNIKPDEIAMIGDQLITDVWGASRMNYFSILIDPIKNNEWFITKINRLFERRIFKKNKLERGIYYE